MRAVMIVVGALTHFASSNASKKACWGTLQAQWLYTNTSVPARMAQHALHSVLVPLSVALTLQHAMPLLVNYRGPDAAYTIMPHAFAGLLMVAMLSLGSAKRRSNADSGDDGIDYIVRGSASKMHMAILLLAPPLMFMASFYRRIMSSNSFMDVWLDLVLVWSVPYLLLYVIHVLRWNSVTPNPYQISLLFGSSSSSTLRGALVPMVISVVASLALEYEYLIPLCRTTAYNFHGHDLPDTWLVSLMLTGAIVSALFAGWVTGRKSSVTGEPLFGDYHDDVLQLSLALSGMLAGKAVGMPWSLTPLPILAILGMVIWLSTRMLRYLAMLLFVVHSAFMVLWSYRYAGIDVKMKLAFGLELNLFRFGMINVAVSMLVFLVMGLAVRSSGGIGHKLMRRFDACGLCLLLYTVLQSILECTLLKYPLPFKDLMGIEVLEHSEDSAFLYKPIVAYVSSATIAGLCLFLQRCKIISAQTAIPILSVVAGKALAIFIDLKLTKKPTGDNEEDAVSLLLRALAATLLLFTMMAPRAFLSPVHFKTSGARHSVSGQAIPLPAGVSRIIMAYGLFMLPLTLVACIPWILRPLVGVLSGHFGAYYITSPAASETFGWVCSLWGLALLSAVNHLLPDGGGETWKKTAALTFLMGLGVALAAPTIPPWLLRGHHHAVAKLNPFASFSSQSPMGGRGSHAGGWGLLSAALATLLAITGPLELQDRTDNSRTDRFLLFRTMVFSILFGCGIAWFVTLESMSDEAFLPIFCTAAACMAMSFFGTVGGVLCYLLELKDFDEAEQVLTVWVGAFPIFLATAGLSQLAKNVAHPFGIGGWLSTYLSVCGMITLAVCLTLRARSTKNSKTRGIGNSSCVLSWACWIAVLYGRFGVAGMDVGFELTTFFGIPASVLGTIVASLILLLLEDESSRSGRGRSNKRVSAASQSTSTTWMCLNLTTLTESNRLAPPMTATVVVLLGASLYAILIRGFISAATHQIVYDSIYSGSAGAEDLASLAKKNLLHLQAVQTTAALAASSLWTAPSPLTPLLYLAGVLATLPSLYGFVLYLWGVTTTAAWAAAVPLNLLPLALCRGLPPLFAASLLGTLGGVYQALAMRGQQQQSKMRI